MHVNSSTNGDRRSDKRFRVEAGALVLKDAHAKVLSGAVLDLSANGLSAIYASDIFDVGQKVATKIEWAGGGYPVNHIQCVVQNKSVLKRRIGFQRKENEYFRYGMNFFNLQEDQRFEVQSCIHYHAMIEG